MATKKKCFEYCDSSVVVEPGIYTIYNVLI